MFLKPLKIGYLKNKDPGYFENKRPSNFRADPYHNLAQNEGFMAKQPRGSVLMAGGGIAGIQAALDMADSGFYVYVVEKSAGIGGIMSQLDKTFPTNDCAM